MRKVLYILRKEDQLPAGLLADQGSSDPSSSVLLVQEGVRLESIPADQVYVLAEEAENRHITSRYPTVSYQEMLDMIFDADSVVCL